jgi:hypothetical protein
VLIKETIEGVHAEIHSFVTPDLQGGECSASRPGRYTAREKAPAIFSVVGRLGPLRLSCREKSTNFLSIDFCYIQCFILLLFLRQVEVTALIQTSILLHKKMIVYILYTTNPEKLSFNLKH